MTISFRARSGQLLAILSVLVPSILLVHHVWREAYLNWRLAHPSKANLEEALTIAPHNCKALLESGVFHSYLADRQDLRLGERFLREAVQCQPLDAGAWSSLASALEFNGQEKEAVAAAEKAVGLAPHYTPILWSTGNVLLRAGMTQEALDLFHKTLEGTPSYAAQVFRACWAEVPDPRMILQGAVPDTPEMNIAYLDFLASGDQNTLHEAPAVWDRLMNSPAHFPAARVFPYFDALLNSDRGEEARADWEEMIRAGILPRPEWPDRDNLIVNGGFEVQPVDGGLDWRIAPVTGVVIGTDRSDFHTGKQSLAVRFEGLANLDFRDATELVPVRPGTLYRFSAYLKAQGISTNSGPYLEISDPQAPERIHWETPGVLGTIGWTKYELPIRTGPDTRVLKIQIVRRPALGFNSRIEGTLWADDLRLTPGR